MPLLSLEDHVVGLPTVFLLGPAFVAPMPLPKWTAHPSGLSKLAVTDQEGPTVGLVYYSFIFDFYIVILILVRCIVQATKISNTVCQVLQTYAEQTIRPSIIPTSGF